MNVRRIVLGGLAAGLLLNLTEGFFNLVLMGPELEAWLKAMHLGPMTRGAIGFYVAWGFVQGLVSVWLYAALRPRLGPGPRTAAAAGLVVWILAYAWPALGNAVMGMAPWSATIKTLAWTAVEAPVAALLGAWLYRRG